MPTRTLCILSRVSPPALQLFHVLRRQMNRPFAKPLVLATPKWLLHHRRATSALEVRQTFKGDKSARVAKNGRADG